MRQGQLADRVNPRTPRPVGDDVAMWCRDMQDERVILDDAVSRRTGLDRSI